MLEELQGGIMDAECRLESLYFEAGFHAGIRIGWELARRPGARAMTSPTVPLPPKGGEAAAMQPNRKTASQCGKPVFPIGQIHSRMMPGVMAGLDGLVVPGGYLDLSNVGLAQQEHGQTGLADGRRRG